MNIKRLILAIVVAFIFIFATDFLIHAVWLAPDYKATAHLWRPEAEMGARFPWMLTAQLLAAITFVLIWAKGFAAHGTPALAIAYGFLIGLAVQVTTIVTYVVSPFPPELALKWFVSGLIQSIALGVVTSFVYKPVIHEPRLTNKKRRVINLILTRIRPIRDILRFFPSPRFLAGALFFLVGALGIGAQAEVELSIFTGVALTQDSDLQIEQSGGTDLTFHNVAYEGRDFETPPYYGVRGLWFPSETSHWGFGAEFFHMKMYAETGDTAHVTGQRGGVGVNANEPIDATIQSFSLSHGLNYALADVVYRWFPGQRGKDFLSHLQPYVGAGIGLAVPHVESTVNETFQEEYQVHGPGVQALAGVNVALTRHWGLMFEYKFTYANLGSLDIPGGSIEMTPLTDHFVTGLTFGF